jgi:hypothetical protein
LATSEVTHPNFFIGVPHSYPEAVLPSVSKWGQPIPQPFFQFQLRRTAIFLQESSDKKNAHYFLGLSGNLPVFMGKKSIFAPRWSSGYPVPGLCFVPIF